MNNNENNINYEDQLKKLRDDLDRQKNIKYKAEARLEQLYSQKEEIVKEIQAQNIDPENLENEISKIKKEIDSLFKQAQELMPKEWFNGYQWLKWLYSKSRKWNQYW